MAKITNDLMAEYMKLKAQKSKVDARLEDIKNIVKEELRAGSSKETADYVASVRLDKSLRACSKDECLRILKATQDELVKQGILVETEARVVVINEKEK